MARLGVNISHVAAIRDALGGDEPDPVWAANQAEIAGADSVLVHFREDRKHLTDRDVRALRDSAQAPFHLEIAPTREMLSVAQEIAPDRVTILPEIGDRADPDAGLDVGVNRNLVADAIGALKAASIQVFVLIEPDVRQVETCTLLGADGVELFTRRYVDARGRAEIERQFLALVETSAAARQRRLFVMAGRGLHYLHAPTLRAATAIDQFNIGHSILGRSLFVGISDAVREMLRLVR